MTQSLSGAPGISRMVYGGWRSETHDAD